MELATKHTLLDDLALKLKNLHFINAIKNKETSARGFKLFCYFMLHFPLTTLYVKVNKREYQRIHVLCLYTTMKLYKFG